MDLPSPLRRPRAWASIAYHARIRIPMTAAEPSTADSAFAARLAAAQFFLAIGWTVYVVFLPDLLGRAGIEARWILWILIADQLVFAASDVAFGFAADRMAAAYRRLGRWLLGLTLVSAAAFLALPWIAPVGPLPLLGLIGLWAVAGSVLRAPTLVLLCRRAREAQRPRHLAAYAAGMAVAGCLAPYLGIALKGADPRLPFALASIALAAAVAALVRLPETAARAGEPPRTPLPGRLLVPLLAAALLAGIGFQVHFSINAAPRFLSVAAKDQLPWLMPLFWIGFNLAMPLAQTLIRRWGALRVALVATGAAGIGAAFCAQAGTLESLGVLQVVTGGAWGLAFVALVEWVAEAGSRGREGAMLGSFFAVLALATVARMLAVALQLPGQAPWKDLLPGLPAVLFATGALVLLAMAAAGAARADRNPGP